MMPLRSSSAGGRKETWRRATVREKTRVCGSAVSSVHVQVPGEDSWTFTPSKAYADASCRHKVHRRNGRCSGRDSLVCENLHRVGLGTSTKPVGGQHRNLVPGKRSQPNNGEAACVDAGIHHNRLCAQPKRPVQDLVP